MNKRMYSNQTNSMSTPRTNLQQRGAMNNYIPAAGNHQSTGNLNNNFVGQGLKRIRGDDFANDGMNAPHRMRWDPAEEEKTFNYLERHDVDQRSETFGQFTNITMNETTVLCFTIHNPKYPITLDVIQKICSITGQILRICILRNRELQVLVEFDSIDTARRIKNELDGADIYSGCCTLKIDFANLKQLIVPINDQENLDLTKDDNRFSRRRTLLLSPPRNDRFESGTLKNENFSQNLSFSGSISTNFDRFSNRQNERFSSRDRSTQNETQRNLSQREIAEKNVDFFPAPFDSSQRFSSNRFRENSPNSESNSFKTENFVFNVEGLLSTRWNCERLFNFLCLYGNVSRVKFLKSKQGGAMVQMNHCDNLRQHLKNLNSAFVFGQKFVIAASRQPEIQPVNRPFLLENGDPSYVEFDTNRNNRYLTNEQAVKNRPVAPSHVLYYFNTPPNMTEIDIVRFFDDVGAKRPVKVKNFPQRKESNHDRSRRGGNQPKGVTGLAEFRTITDACECLILANNYPIPHESSNWPFFFKLTFSSTPITDEDARLGEEIDTSLATVTIESGRRHHSHHKSTDEQSRSDSPQEHRRRRHSSPSN